MSCSDQAMMEGGHTLTVPWWSFVALRPHISAMVRSFGMKLGTDLQISAEAEALLKKSSRAAQSYTQASQALVMSDQDVLGRLGRVSFARSLTTEQMRNVKRLAAVPAGATFSVPGAGKTTEALATFFCRAADDDRLLVIAPKNAFAAWDEQLESCAPTCKDHFVRLVNGQESIRQLLNGNPRFMLITYQQLTRVRDLIAETIAGAPTHVFLDESHRIKNGTGQASQIIQSISHLPASKLVMSGTPMPQSHADLLPQFSFLFPEITATENDVVSLMQPIYVRTTKTELCLPPVDRLVRKLEMSPLQDQLYRLMKSEVARDCSAFLTTRSKQAFRYLGRSVARLLQFVSNPSLLASEIGFAHGDLLGAVLADGQGPKMRYVLKRARGLAREGNKVLIWSSFVRNVEYIAESLQDIGAVYIHGGVGIGDEEDDDSREGKIKRFHSDPNVMVMVANPAAASEGISLHRVCHHAIYLDRSFNAAHYLQSEDRIHRLGLSPDQHTTIEIVECINTVDETVQSRLNFKVRQMGQALADPGLRIDPLPMDAMEAEDELYTGGLEIDDVRSLLSDLER